MALVPYSRSPDTRRFAFQPRRAFDLLPQVDGTRASVAGGYNQPRHLNNANGSSPLATISPMANG
jgi:hypothetical protein